MLASHIATNKSYEAFLAASPTSLVQRIASGKTANRNSRLLVSSILNMFIRQRNRGYNKTNEYSTMVIRNTLLHMF